MFKILISDNLATEAIDALKNEKDCEVVVKTGLSEAELIKEIPPYDAIIIRSATTVTAKIIKAGKKLKLIGRAGAGTDNVDKVAASAAGILVVNAPTGNLTSVAELVFGCILNVMRKIGEADISTKAGKWEKSRLGKLGREIDSKTLGIVGLGKIGQLVAKRAKGFNLRVLAYDPVISQDVADEVNAELVSLDEVLKQSDIITLHIPLIPQTKHLISSKQFKSMKKDALLLNCARGGVVDEVALLKWLKTNSTAAACLDCFESEPVETSNPLTKLDNCFFTPHLGASTYEAQVKVGLQLMNQVIRALRGEIVEYVVNLPFRAEGNLPNQKAWGELAEKLAKIAAQLLDKASLKKATLTVSGELADCDNKVLQVAILKGLLETLSDVENVNFINAADLAKKRGLQLEVKTAKASGNIRSELGLKIQSSKENIEVKGVVENDKPRIRFIQGFRVGFTPRDNVFLTLHKDIPGMIGRVASLLGENKVNIANLDLSRNKVGGKALMTLDIDGEIPEKILKQMQGWKEFEKVVNLEF
jgi:D-3-phosphoglycerate dehydrogenase